MNIEPFLIQNQWVIFLMILWTIPWKGAALWKAAKNNHRNWFIALLIINTLGILEILYIFIFSRTKKMPQIIDLKNQPMGKTDVRSEPSSETKQPITIEWQAPEFEKYEKDNSWFIKLGVFLLIFFIISLFAKNFLFSLIILLAGFSVYVYAQKKPRLITFKISARGIAVDKALYPFEDLKSFWIFYEPPEVKYLSLRSKKRLMPYIHLPMGEQNPVEIRKVLIEFLPEIHQEESTTDVLARRLRF